MLFAERFGTRQLPIWINEGVALLADSPSKQSLHKRDCCQAVANGSQFRIRDLVAFTDYPDPRRWPALYGQSLSLVSFLVDRKSPQAFVKFIEKSFERGMDAALLEIYDLSNVNALERAWRFDLQQRAETPLASRFRSQSGLQRP